MAAAGAAAAAPRPRDHQEQILQSWGQDANASNAIEVYIHRLRKKLEGAGVAVRTVRGLGYLLEASP
jgi:two-component system OmpR family response regulator